MELETPEPIVAQSASTVGGEEDEYDKITVELESGLELRDLQEEKGVQFEIKTPAHQDADPDAAEYFDSEEVFKQLNRECLGDDEDNEDENSTPFEKLRQKMESITPEQNTKVMKSVLRQGTGLLPVMGVTMTVHYNCYLEYSDEPYDSTRLRNRPEKFKLGAGQLVPGMELALSTMRQGEMSKFLIHPDYAYGKMGVPPRIPENATILMEIEMLNFTDRADLDEFNAMSEEERKEVTFKKKLLVVKTEQKEGNELFNEGHHSKALSKYMRAVRILDGAHMRNQEDEDEMRRIQIKLCLNIALCALHLKQCDRAIANCNRVLEVERKNPKALFRKGKAFMQKGDFSAAQKFMSQAQQQLPSDPSIARGLQELEKNWARFKTMERTMYGKMFPTWNKDSGQRGDESRGKVPEEYKAMIREKLKVFQEMSNIVEMPFQARSLTLAETNFLETVAKEMNMTVQKREYHGDKIIKIIKAPASDPEQ